MWVTRYVRVHRKTVTSYLKVGLIFVLTQVVLLFVFHITTAPREHPPLSIAGFNGDIKPAAFPRYISSDHFHNNPDDVSNNTLHRQQQGLKHMQNRPAGPPDQQTGGQENTPKDFRRQHGGGIEQVLRGPRQRQIQRSGLQSDAVALDVRDSRRQAFLGYIQKRERKGAVLSRGCPRRDVQGHVTNMVFVKVHKSASSTVANVMARYALRHALNVALPRKVPGVKRFNYFETKILPQEVIQAPTGQQYHVLFNHMIFNRQDLRAFMPNNSFYFAIMRNPEDRFISSFVYYRIAEFLMKRFALASVKDALMFLINRVDLFAFSRPEVYNSLAGDTGLNASKHRDLQAVQAHIRRLERELDLIMVVEYFDESLVLLKRKACMSMQDIVYSVKNARPQWARVRPSLTPQERESFRNFQMADVLIYDHFYKRFWDLVYAEDPDFFIEVRRFKQIRRTVEDFCGGLTSPWDFVTISKSVWNEEFIVTAKECRLMAMTELEMQVFLIHRASVLSGMSG